VKYFPQLKATLFLASLIPFIRLAWFGYTGQLGANPIEFITRSLGTWTLVFLLITLSITPLRNLSGWSWLIRLRRMAGLFAFWLDQFFDLHDIYKDVIKRPFITIGFAAFIMLIPLALTSTNAMIKRLGGKRWLLLHRLVYLIAFCGALHYWWLVKKDITQPLIYAAVLATLLIYRVVSRSLKIKKSN
jgi:methionine sulfoxide reductase heme-binding subunit